MSYDKNHRIKGQDIKHPGGAPRMFRSPDQMIPLIDNYFEDCDNREVLEYDKNYVGHIVKKPEPYTVAGLALALGFSSRQTLLDYEQLDDRQEYADIIKKAKLKIECYNNKALHEGKNPIGPIFTLKCGFGYQDKQEVDVKQDITITFASQEEGADYSK